MKMPEEVKGRNKLRDFNICRLYAEEAKSQDEIGKLYDLTKVRIGKILRINKVLLTPDREWEKHKRINWYKRQIKKRGDSKRDSAEFVDRLRVEIEGDKPLVDNSTHITKITKIEVKVSDDTAVPLTQESGNRISGERKLPI